MAVLAILWTSLSLIFPSSFCRRAFSPVPASLDTKAPMIPCMAIRLLPLSLHFFASFSYFSASMLLFSFLAFPFFLYSSFSLCPAMSPIKQYPTGERTFTYSTFSSIFFWSKILLFWMNRYRIF